MKIVKYNSLRPNRWWRLLATAALALPALGAVADSYYGYAPIDPDPATLTAQGSGNNGYAEAAIEPRPGVKSARSHAERQEDKRREMLYAL